MIALLLVGCGGPEATATWTEELGFGWQYFNHRVSHLELGADDDVAYASVIGGTSTTNVVTELDDGCDPGTCTEFPFIDFADIRLVTARATTTNAVFGSGSAELVVDADGEGVPLTIELPTRGKGDVTAVIRGFSFDTDEPLSGGVACYQPKNGWVPSGFGITLGDPVLSDDGGSITLDVSARFGAGPTREEVRACLDAVLDQARVAVRVDVLAVVSKQPMRSADVSQQASWALEDEQPPPDAVSLDGDLSGALVGWTSFGFDFHHEQDAGRGAYLRTVGLPIDAVAGLANGVASNVSPGTQLSGFDYTFDGTVGIVELDAEVTRTTIEERIDVVVGERTEW